MGGPAVRRRFWVESALAGIGTLLAVVTALVPDWVERLGGTGGDAGGGGTERAIAVLFLVAAAVPGMLARAEWRRPPVPVRVRSGRGGDDHR
jgi:hypothetical protein